MKEVKNDRAERESLIDSIIEMHFSQIKWSESVGLTASVNQAVQQALTLAGELKTKPLDELKFLYEQAIANRSQAEDGEDEQEIEDDEDKAFFNEGEAMADFAHWASFDSWTLEEAVALCLGREPKVVNSSTLRPWRERSKFVVQFERNLDRARRAQQFGALQEHVCPKSFLNWADRKRIEYPAALREAVIAHQRDNTRSDDGSETTQERSAPFGRRFRSSKLSWPRRIRSPSQRSIRLFMCSQPKNVHLNVDLNLLRTGIFQRWSNLFGRRHHCTASHRQTMNPSVAVCKRLANTWPRCWRGALKVRRRFRGDFWQIAQ